MGEERSPSRGVAEPSNCTEWAQTSTPYSDGHCPFCQHDARFHGPSVCVACLQAAERVRRRRESLEASRRRFATLPESTRNTILEGFAKADEHARRISRGFRP